MAASAAGQLTWTEVTNFKGLYSAGFSGRPDVMTPADGFMVLSGCHPQPQGGLRAMWGVVDTVTASGITSGATAEAVAGFHVRSRRSTAAIYSSTEELVLYTHDANTTPLADWRLWRFRNTVDASWSNVGGPFSGDTSFGPPAIPGPIQGFFAEHAISLSPPGVAFASAFVQSSMFLSANTQSANAGLYVVNINTGTHTVVPGAGGLFGIGPIASHQARLVIGLYENIVWTDTNSLTMANPNANFLVPAADDAIIQTDSQSTDRGMIAWICPVPPSDLMVCTLGGRLFNIQGDLLDPVVRELGRWAETAWQQPVLTPYGVACMSPNYGVQLLQPSGDNKLLSPQLSPALWRMNGAAGGSNALIGMGRLAFSRSLLFCPNFSPSVQHSGGLTNTANSNGALIYDFDSDSWFTGPHADDAVITGGSVFAAADHTTGNSGVWLLAAQTFNGTGNAAYKIATGGSTLGSSAAERRATTWEAVTAPLRDPSGRQVEIRQIRLNIVALNSVSTVAVTVNGTTNTATLVDGAQVITLDFRERAQYLDIKIKAKSNTTAEAPILESMAFGWQAGHLI